MRRETEGQRDWGCGEGEGENDGEKDGEKEEVTGITVRGVSATPASENVTPFMQAARFGHAIQRRRLLYTP